MVDGPGQPTSDAAHLNRLRFYLDEWTDMLLAQLGDCHGSRLYCHRLHRMQEWAEEFSSRPYNECGGLETQLRLLGMRRWLSKSSVMGDANPNLNLSIGQAAMAMLRPEWFDSLGCLRSLAAHRMQSIIAETDGLVSTLLSSNVDQSSVPDVHESLERYRKSGSSDPFHR